MPGFAQDPPRLANTFEADLALRESLERLLPTEVHAELLPQWRDLGSAAAGRLRDLARQAEADPPQHVPYDAWGRRVDEIRVCAAWKELHREAARRGLTAVPYEGGLGAFARLHQFALLLLYGPSSAICSCPIAMTDGAARTLLEHDPGGLARHAVPHLTSRDPDAFWTSGQWMTEQRGGSDVSGTETTARRDGEGRFRLFGAKWFTSATTSEIALTLARTDDAAAGAAGLSLFYLEQRLADGSRNGIVVRRLKDKLGTRALPTAEIDLQGTIAIAVGGLGGGVKKITPLLNITRLHNAVSACGIMARVVQLARDFAARRVVFGDLLARRPLHRETLAGLQVEYEAALALTLDCARLLGRQDAGEAGEDERLTLRLLTPLVKLMTAKQAVAAASEGLEAFGGAGYVEDTGLPVLLRDAQVLPIWEGTTNVLSLDVLRAATRDGAFTAWLATARRRAWALRGGPLADVAEDLGRRLDEIDVVFSRTLDAGSAFAEAAARRLALCLAAVSAALPLAEQGAWAAAAGRGVRRAMAARVWATERIPLPLDPRDAAARLKAAAHLSGGGDEDPREP